MGTERTETAIRRERFSGGPARSFLSSMDVDERIFDADLAVDRAHVVMLAEQGIIDDTEAGEILDALAGVEADGFDALPAAEDVHEAIESAVIERAGPAGERMHTARSRNDEVATCLRVRLRDDLLEAAEATVELRSALLDCARTEAETLMAGLTHLQPAQPTTVGHWAASYASTVERDTERLLDTYARLNHSPLGAAAFAGTPFPIDRERTAALLGFDGIVENAMDASSSRDVFLEATGACLVLGTTLSGISEDMILFTHRGDVELDDDYASTSSIMPQKKNPDTLELSRARAGDTLASVTGLATTLKGLPRAYNRDLQRASRHVWQGIDAVTEATPVVAGAISTATWRREELADAAGEGFSTATGVADALTEAGVPFRTAHEVVAEAAKRLEDGDADVSNPEAQMDAIRLVAREDDDIGSIETYLDETHVADVLDPAASVAARDSSGGPAPESLRENCEHLEATLQTHRSAIADRRAALGDAAHALAAEVGTYV